MLSYEWGGFYCELAKQWPSSHCTHADPSACSSPQDKSGHCQEGLEPTVCVPPRGNMLPWQGAHIHELNRAVTRDAVSTQHASAPATNPGINSKAELLQAQAVDCDMMGVLAHLRPQTESVM